MIFNGDFPRRSVVKLYGEGGVTLGCGANSAVLLLCQTLLNIRLLTEALSTHWTGLGTGHMAFSAITKLWSYDTLACQNISYTGEKQ